jgi:hypothetical protein
MKDTGSQQGVQDTASSLSDRSGFWRFFVLATLLAVYVGWPNAVFIEAEDSIVFLGNILRDAPHYHPNHLLFEPFYHAVLQLARGLWPGIEAIAFLQGITVGFSLVTLWASYLLIAPRAGHTAAVVGTGLIAMSFGFWHYSKVVDAYVPALTLALLALVVFDRRASMPGPVMALALAGLAGAATLIHQLYVFHAALLFVALLLAGRVRDAFLYGVLCCGGVFAVYWTVYTGVSDGAPSLGGFIDWAKGHARNGLWLAPSARTPFLATVELGTGLVYAAPFLAVPGLFGFAERMSGNQSIEEEQFIALEVLGRDLSILLAVLALVAALCCVWLVGTAIRYRGRPHFDVTERYLLAFISLYGLLACIWEAVNREFWIHVLVATAVLVAARLRASPGPVPERVGLLAVVLLGIVNFTSAILPFSERSNDFWWRETAEVVRQLDRDDVVVVECPWLCARYIEFFSEARVYRYQQLDGFGPGPDGGRDRFAFQRLDQATLRPVVE